MTARAPSLSGLTKGAGASPSHNSLSLRTWRCGEREYNSSWAFFYAAAEKFSLIRNAECTQKTFIQREESVVSRRMIILVLVLRTLYCRMFLDISFLSRSSTRAITSTARWRPWYTTFPVRCGKRCRTSGTATVTDPSELVEHAMVLDVDECGVAA